MNTHFDEIQQELRDFYRDTALSKNVALLLWLPRLYRIIKHQLPGDEWKLGFVDVYTLHERELSIVNVSNASQCIDFVNLAIHFNCSNIIGIGLTGAYRFDIGTLFVAEEAISEEMLTSYFCDRKTGVYCESLFQKNKETLRKFSEANMTTLEVGKTVSLDLFSRETRAFIERYEQLVDTIDLEVAPLYLMANLHHINCFALFIVSDTTDVSYFLRKTEEIRIIHEIYNGIPDLLLELAF